MTGSHLRELARLYGIQLSYEDAAKKKRFAPRESLNAILGARLGTVNREALDARRDELARRVVEPVTPIFGRRAIRVPVQLTGSVAYEIELENRDRYAGRLDVIDGAITIPHKLPIGYHKLRIDDAHETMLFIAPLRAPAPSARAWGIFLPLYAAQSERSWGVGDLGTLQSFRSWMNEMGGGIVATLPLLAAFEDEPSPYSPVSRLFWNELYLDIDRLPEHDRADRDEADIAFLRHASHVDYARAHRMKRRALLRMSERFQPDAAFEEFALRASDYAEFRAHKERERRSEAEDERPVGTHRYHLYVQYRMAQQMRAVADDARRNGLGLYLDFPLGVNAGGYDAWRYRDQFAKGVSVGAPPDLFFTKGQNWGFPPLDPETAREHHYDYFRACIRHHVEHAGILRFDHVMGLHRLFWIPKGGEAKDGVYVRYHDEELYAALLIEASRTSTVIVGEDLGTVPESVPKTMARHGLRRMYVVQYEQKLTPPSAESVASVNTHDMPTFAGFWREKDIDDRVAQGLLDEHGAVDERAAREQLRDDFTRQLAARDLLHHDTGDMTAVLQALLAFLAESDAEIVLVNLEDLWLEPEPQNAPGVPGRSWRQKLRMTLEQASADNTVKRLLHTVEDKRRKVDGHT
jgi:4-alpha-glucanotransferase